MKPNFLINRNLFKCIRVHSYNGIPCKITQNQGDRFVCAHSGICLTGPYIQSFLQGIHVLLEEHIGLAEKFHKMLWKNLNRLFGQPTVWKARPEQYVCSQILEHVQSQPLSMERAGEVMYTHTHTHTHTHHNLVIFLFRLKTVSSHQYLFPVQPNRIHSCFLFS